MEGSSGGGQIAIAAAHRDARERHHAGAPPTGQNRDREGEGKNVQTDFSECAKYFSYDDTYQHGAK